MPPVPPPFRSQSRTKTGEMQTETAPGKQTQLLPRGVGRIIGVVLLLATVGLTSCQAFIHSFPSLLP